MAHYGINSNESGRFMRAMYRACRNILVCLKFQAHAESGADGYARMKHGDTDGRVRLVC